MKRFDAIVIGVGAMGSATCYELARRGKRVLGLERFDIPHELGSSHGYTRIIRLAYYEHPSYVPLLQRAYELWREIQARAGEQLLHITGSIDAGPPDSPVLKGSLHSCVEHGLAHEILTGAELARRFPGYRLPQDTLALLQPEGGFLLPERCIVAYVTAAQALGAELHGREQVLEWQPVGDGVRVRTDRDVYEADRLVITAGAWSGQLLDFCASWPCRSGKCWPGSSRHGRSCSSRHVSRCSTCWSKRGRFYGFPVFGVPGFKFGKYHHLEERADPDAVDRAVHPRDEHLLREFAARYFPDGAGPTMALKTCLFTNTKDEHFVIDLHPEYPQVVIASPCSGHGFKFASVVGEILAELTERGESRHDIGLFRLAPLLEGASRLQG